MIPNIISAAAWALIYRFIFNDQMGILNEAIRVIDKDSVSYTHLTLPTIRLV